MVVTKSSRRNEKKKKKQQQQRVPARYWSLVVIRYILLTTRGL